MGNRMGNRMGSGFRVQNLPFPLFCNWFIIAQMAKRR